MLSISLPSATLAISSVLDVHFSICLLSIFSILTLFSSVNFLSSLLIFLFFFFFNDTATTEIYTLSLHDPLPISSRGSKNRHPMNYHARNHPMKRTHRKWLSGAILFVALAALGFGCGCGGKKDTPHPQPNPKAASADRKSTPLNSSHTVNSYAGFC